MSGNEFDDDYSPAQASYPSYPHDGSEILGTLGKQTFRCTRGNCNADIGHPTNQTQHNHDEHLTSIWDEVE